MLPILKMAECKTILLLRALHQFPYFAILLASFVRGICLIAVQAEGYTSRHSAGKMAEVDLKHAVGEN